MGTYAQDNMKKFGLPFDPGHVKSSGGFRFGDRIKLTNALERALWGGPPEGTTGRVWAIQGAKGLSVSPDPLGKMIYVKWDGGGEGSVWAGSIEKIKTHNPYDAKNDKWYKEGPWHGKIERSECTKHEYVWTGRVPCTGVRRCWLCGKPDPNQNPLAETLVAAGATLGTAALTGVGLGAGVIGAKKLMGVQKNPGTWMPQNVLDHVPVSCWISRTFGEDGAEAIRQLPIYRQNIGHGIGADCTVHLYHNKTRGWAILVCGPDYRPAYRRNPAEQIYVPGVIITFSWGYEQTNIDFFKIIERKGDFVTLVPMTSVQVPRPMDPWATGHVIPGVVKDGEKPFRRKVHKGRDGREIGIAIRSYGWASKWDGEPENYTAYANPGKYKNYKPVAFTGLKFPIVNIGQLSKQQVNRLNLMVKKGALIKYVDYTFPKTKTGYAMLDPHYGESRQEQRVRRSLESLVNGSWKYVPEAQVKAAEGLLRELHLNNPLDWASVGIGVSTAVAGNIITSSYKAKQMVNRLIKKFKIKKA